MNLRQVLALVRKRWLSLFGCILIGLAAAGAQIYTANPVYSSTARCFVSVASLAGGGSLFQGSQFAQTRVKSYTDIVDSPAVLEPVIRKLDLRMSVPALAQRIVAINPAGTVLINVTASSPDPQRAAQIANAVAAQYSTVIEDLETARAGGQSPVKVTVTGPAVPAGRPTSPRPDLALALGLLLGLGGGVGLALVRDRLDNSVTTGALLGELTGKTPLGLVPYDSHMRSHRLVVLDSTSSSGEAFRSIRTNLQFVDVDRPPRAIVVTSATASEGKTTTACNLAASLSRSGRRVCLVEADLRRPKVAEYMGVEGGVGLTNILAHQAELDDVLSPWGDENLMILAGGSAPPDPSELLGSKRMRVLLEELLERFEVVILDSPPVLPVTDAAVLGHIADGAILVVRSQRATRDQVSAAVDAMEAAKVNLIGTVMTFAARSASPYSYGYKSVPRQTPKRSRRRRRAERHAASHHRAAGGERSGR